VSLRLYAGVLRQAQTTVDYCWFDLRGPEETDLIGGCVSETAGHFRAPARSGLVRSRVVLALHKQSANGSHWI
jgi:hypothetical protein